MGRETWMLDQGVFDLDHARQDVPCFISYGLDLGLLGLVRLQLRVVKVEPYWVGRGVDAGLAVESGGQGYQKEV